MELFAPLARVIGFALVCSGQPLEFLRYESGIPPDDCIEDKKTALKTYTKVEQFEKCAPFLLPDYAWKYFLGAAGLRNTFEENFKAYRRLRIKPRILRDVSELDMSTVVLNEWIPFPIGLSPVALQKLASPLGEIDTVRAVAAAGNVMIVSSSASTVFEDIYDAGPSAVKWMQTYIYKDREVTINIVRRAENMGFKAIVVTVDAPIDGPIELPAVNISENNPQGIKFENVPVDADPDNSITFKDISWLKSMTKLPVVAKGILSGEDALRAAAAGASAILVSNHGGRQLDFAPATIDSLGEVVSALQPLFPSVEVYIDGGVRNGYDVFKAIARGAKMVFIGRPIVWGLTYGGEEGLRKVFDILKKQLNETMQLAGTPNLHSINRRMIRQEITVEAKGEF